MLTLYYKASCPFCQDVLGEAEALTLTFNLKDISAVQAYADELVALGGKHQVPYLVDEETKVAMYESNDIIAYMRNYTKEKPKSSSFGGLRIHKSDDTCDTCQ